MRHLLPLHRLRQARPLLGLAAVALLALGLTRCEPGPATTADEPKTWRQASQMPEAQAQAYCHCIDTLIAYMQTARRARELAGATLGLEMCSNRLTQERIALHKALQGQEHLIQRIDTLYREAVGRCNRRYMMAYQAQEDSMGFDLPGRSLREQEPLPRRERSTEMPRRADQPHPLTDETP